MIESAMKGLDETVKVYRSNINRMYGDTHYGYPEYERTKKAWLYFRYGIWKRGKM